MKIFLVDIQNCLDFSHYETFFYKSIREGRIALFERSLSSVEELGVIRNWLTAEINRNPFSLDECLVVFFLPRDFRLPRVTQDYEEYVKIYIHEMIGKHMDARFRYVCFFVDGTDSLARHDRVYQEIQSVRDHFTSDDPSLRSAFLPSALPIGENESPDTALSRALDTLTDVTVADFYRSVLQEVSRKENQHGVNKLNDQERYKVLFLSACRDVIAPYKDFHVSYFTDDVSKKIEVVLKIVNYIRDFADLFDQKKPLDDRIGQFINPQNFDNFQVDFETIKKTIVTYKYRLSQWDPELEETIKDPEPFKHTPTKFHLQFQQDMERVSRDDLRRALSPDDQELSTFNITDRVFASLDQLLQSVDKLMQSFCKHCIDEMRSFWDTCNPTMTELAAGENCEPDEQEAQEKLASAMNQYSVNSLPGFSEELRLRQKLDLAGKKIRALGKLIDVMKPLMFLLTVLFAIAVVGAYYFGTQYTVFVKENTWYVFGLYLIVFAVLCSGIRLLVKHYIKKKIQECLDHCMQYVDEYLNSYIIRAQEFERNLNAAMHYYCRVDNDNKKSEIRSNQKDRHDRIQWHKLKIKKILANLKFFDSMVRDYKPDRTDNPPELDPFADDAAHCAFYQMRIFSATYDEQGQE